jgi:hypothetical protein
MFLAAPDDRLPYRVYLGRFVWRYQRATALSPAVRLVPITELILDLYGRGDRI